MSFNSGILAGTNFFVSPAGALAANGLTTTGTIAAQSATMTGVTVTDGGRYATKPTIVVQAPPAGGTTATITVQTLGLDFVAAIAAAGAGYTANDVLTVSGGTSTTTAQITVSAVDGSGAITAATVSRAGSYTVLPANQASVTGGTGTGATFTLAYTILTVSSTAGSGYAASPPPYVWTTTTGYRVATLTPTMTAADAPLTLTASRYKLTLASIPDYADDAAAATGGLAVGDLYRTGSALKTRSA